MKKIGKRITTALVILLGVIVAALLFVYFMPGWGLYFVKSGSMVPSINPGDIVITRPVGEIRPDMVVTFEQGEAIVTHRVMELVDGKLRTKGDANEDMDPDLLSITNVQGIYLFKIPYIGYINNLVSDRKGWFIVIIIPTIILVLFIVKDIFKEAFKGSNDDKKVTEGGKAIEGKETANTANNGNQIQSNKR
jgi:signal peptidase